MFVRTPYRQVSVSKSGRWAAEVPGYKRYLPANRIVLIDRVRHKEYSVKMPVGATSAQWSPDGRTLLLTAYRMRGTAYKTIGFVTINVTERKPRLVKAGSAWTVSDWDVGMKGGFFWNADGTGVMSTLKNDKGIAAYNLSGGRTRVYTGVGSLEARVTSLFSPSGRQFVSLGGGDSSYTRAILIVDAETGKVVHRLRGGFQGWYDDNHVIVMYRTAVQPSAVPTSTFRLVSLDGKAGMVLIQEQLRYTNAIADYKAHIAWLDFSR
ncbi:hypothetical protein GCM10022226_27460 [Sphaerisporangium flaviroseum]|uniref:Uncharacterized protein n=1 Tax=Sphaerisporangium flaviroseum TaxID=509199 RepID=A0ABP7HW70_9ACTN